MKLDRRINFCSLKSQADKALSHKVFLVFVYTISVELIKDFIGDKFVISPYRLGICALEKFCINSVFEGFFPGKMSRRLECPVCCQGNFVLRLLPAEHCSIVKS